MAEQELPERIKIDLELQVSGVSESFEVSIEPGSYVSELISVTLEQCEIDNVPPERCQLCLVTKTSGM